MNKNKEKTTDEVDEKLVTDSEPLESQILNHWWG